MYSLNIESISMYQPTGFTEADVPDQSGKCFIVTGANAGVGFEIARVLAARGARVLLGCREQTKAQDAMTRIKRITPNADLVWLPLDLGDLDSVRAAAEIAAKEPRIDALINNAGIMNPPLTRTKNECPPAEPGVTATNGCVPAA